MKLLTPKDSAQIVQLLLAGNVGVLPTDTIYGLHCLAFSEDSKLKVAKLKNQELSKPFISIISHMDDLNLFDIALTNAVEAMLKTRWPGPNTIILPTKQGTTAALRWPNNKFLEEILAKTGPLISTSANVHTQPNATTVQQAISYFGNRVDFYVDAGPLYNPPSNMFDTTSGEIVRVR
jgi:L-threonylcarbamoyladenylate synthase